MKPDTKRLTPHSWEIGWKEKVSTSNGDKSYDAVSALKLKVLHN